MRGKRKRASLWVLSSRPHAGMIGSRQTDGLFSLPLDIFIPPSCLYLKMYDTGRSVVREVDYFSSRCSLTGLCIPSFFFFECCFSLYSYYPVEDIPQPSKQPSQAMRIELEQQEKSHPLDIYCRLGSPRRPFWYFWGGLMAAKSSRSSLRRVHATHTNEISKMLHKGSVRYHNRLTLSNNQ
jgi:hypothetical protein